jgi:hypothetical protein
VLNMVSLSSVLLSLCLCVVMITGIVFISVFATRGDTGAVIITDVVWNSCILLLGNCIIGVWCDRCLLHLLLHFCQCWISLVWIQEILNTQ